MIICSVGNVLRCMEMNSLKMSQKSLFAASLNHRILKSENAVNVTINFIRLNVTLFLELRADNDIDCTDSSCFSYRKKFDAKGESKIMFGKTFSQVANLSLGC
jgi:hypothetical protein